MFRKLRTDIIIMQTVWLRAWNVLPLTLSAALSGSTASEHFWFFSFFWSARKSAETVHSS